VPAGQVEHFDEGVGAPLRGAAVVVLAGAAAQCFQDGAQDLRVAVGELEGAAVAAVVLVVQVQPPAAAGLLVVGVQRGFAERGEPVRDLAGDRVRVAGR